MVFLPVIIMASISAYVGFRNLSLYFLKRQNIVNLLFSVFCFAIVGFDLSGFFLYNSASPASVADLVKLRLLSAGMIAIIIVPFMFSVLKKRLTRAASIFIGLSGLSFVLILVLPNDFIFDFHSSFLKTFNFLGTNISFYEAKLNPVSIPVILFFSVSIVYVTFILLRSIKNNRREIIPILIGFSIFFVSSFLDVAAAFGFLKIVYTTEYSFLSIVVLMDYSLMRHLSELYRDQEAVQENLEKQVEERTNDIRLLAEKLGEQNERLEELVERDSLTALYNHAAFYKRLHAFVNASRRHRFALSIIVLDIDDFKNFNDKYGHHFGDTVIRSIASILRNTSREYDEKVRNVVETALRRPENTVVRDYDIISRYGGDEFTVLLLYCGQNEATIVARRLNDKITGLRFAEFPDVAVTCSMGVVFLEIDIPCSNGEDLFKVADKALYEAKRSGKNQFVISPYNQKE
jgi:GGDEF domain-containing protein